MRALVAASMDNELAETIGRRATRRTALHRDAWLACPGKPRQ